MFLLHNWHKVSVILGIETSEDKLIYQWALCNLQTILGLMLLSSVDQNFVHAKINICGGSFPYGIYLLICAPIVLFSEPNIKHDSKRL